MECDLLILDKMWLLDVWGQQRSSYENYLYSMSSDWDFDLIESQYTVIISEYLYLIAAVCSDSEICCSVIKTCRNKANYWIEVVL